MKVLVDMNLSPRWVPLLEEAGYSVAHWSAIGVASAPDTEIMAFAKNNEYVVLTHDLDFGAMLTKTQDDGPSVLQVRCNDLDPDVIGPAVLSALGEICGRRDGHLLVTVEPHRMRMRLLPFS